MTPAVSGMIYRKKRKAGYIHYCRVTSVSRETNTDPENSMSSLFDTTEQLYTQTDFTLLTRLLTQTGRTLHYERGVTLQPREGEVLVVLRGQMTVSDAAEDGLALGHTFMYMPVGLMERYYHLPLYYRAETRTTVVQLTAEETDEVFLSTRERAALFSRIMAYMSSTLIHIYYERNNESGYATIREMLHRYMYKAGENTLSNEGIAAFILKRTRLSRSYVFQILAGLKAGGYITVEQGKLVSINRDIPERY
ncbi:TPA: helix-turn-helix domain-containing protein [Klebsiella aerogenes]|nr:helix-turn-helix domain-containing protein [Klebsiella aerogenes]HCB2881681.1 helix-turn-helix domain-containing protein [Klebsiella aerogenes]HCB3346429.1 helix-turn-helix domain-containing protein [Klebsiella aerogenes]HCM1812530.1 helix-turn-helix domain-containing protein [Klebsiella aerogenes]